MGNTKFDSCKIESSFADDELAELAQALGANQSGPLWLAGSTHEGEEDKLLDVFKALRNRFADLRLVLAPRYIERAERVMTLASERRIPCALRSQGANSEPVVVLDSVGELRDAYRLATLVVVGGSFVRRGGQNILEPAASGKPVLFGPHMENFKEISRLFLSHHAAIQIRNGDELTEKILMLLGNEEECHRISRNARRLAVANQGAIRKTITAIMENLQSKTA
jgi:3-deoxy-D-manno-octulosonic-acid transferase